MKITQIRPLKEVKCPKCKIGYLEEPFRQEYHRCSVCNRKFIIE